MSGDVQPRKRKDKRRKRYDDESSHGVHITKMGNEDLHLHVHHEHGTGGHWCAKIIFFALMAVLLGLVGLIIMENRGLEDLDTPLSESRFSKVFDGWVDEHRDDHDAHGAHEPSGEALDDHDDHDEHDDHDDHDDHDEEEEEPLSEELEDEIEEEEEEPAEEEEPEADEEDEEDEDEDNNAGENITAEDAEEDEEEDNEEEGTVEATVEATTEATTEATAEYEAEDEEEEEAEADEDAVESAEVPPSEAEEQEEEDEDEEDHEEQEVEESVEPPRSQSAAQSSPAPDDNDDDDEDEEQNNDDADDDFESLDQQFENDPEEQEPKQAVDSQEDQDQDKDADEEPEEEGSSWLASLAVKFGVGVALALVSRLVLIRKSPNTTEDEPTPEAIMRRRLTIATAEDHIPDDVEELPLLDDEYSEEEIEIEEEIEVEISDIEEDEDEEEEEVRHDSDDNLASMASYVPETFEQLSAMYKVAQEPPKESKPEQKEKEKDKEKEKEKVMEKEPDQQAGPSDIYVEYENGPCEDYDSDEEITDEEDEISDVDDADLMSRLEAKYGRLTVQKNDSYPDSDDSDWEQINPNEAAPVAAEKEDPFEQELRKANEEMIRENYAQALRSFNTLTTNFAHEPLAHLGRARVLELLSKEERSNQRLWEAIDAYKRYLAFGELVISDQDFTSAGESCIENLRFLGYHRQATTIHELLINRLPKDPRLRNQLSLTHLMVNNLQQVEKVAEETLKDWPANAVAQLHYGLALRQLRGDYEKALPYLKYAVESQEEGTQEAFFYLSLGETLQRLSRQSEALDVYRKGVAKGFFASLYQRSLYNEPRLKAQPFWQPTETGYERQLEKLQLNWRAIRDEGLALLGRNGFFEDEAEQLRDKGVWQQFELYAQGRRVKDNCRRTPITCSLLQEFPESGGCRRGQVKFSVMQAKTHVWSHCGPTNCRLRAHLTLVAPEPEKTSLRVAEQERTWREGELFIFDDSFEHEVWHNGTHARLVLILDMWHPDLTPTQRRSLTPI
ncbi:aspartyl/asparaginyl beta-hydroxylase isoform X5 [Drosophila gunungcola]|uniref:aspartyl/asparaginyl beta-hydroxylase isoform X5 n=1 Tax=Drosophila gunungcola TaxID=103775 RepID=UPI0022E3772F|nr:aspartyl/asparaginyl beta-hydroxylase isoform X5 [Drosophila gunungcola]